MTVKAAFIIDPIEHFNIQKDSTYMMMKAADIKNWQQYILQFNDLFAQDGHAYGLATPIELPKEGERWYNKHATQKMNLSEFDVIFMRKDPPFDMEYIYATYILELAEKAGVLVVNKPGTLRDANEKFSIMNYPKLTPNTLVTRSFHQINEFLQKHRDIVVKPLDGMGGESIFRITQNDVNKNVILETITRYQSQFIMAQAYQPAIVDGDKRILIIDGAPVSHLVARIPSLEDGRGNTARGASTKVRQLNQKEYDIASVIGKDLKKQGVLFAGIDVIGECLTEINITSPTMIQQIYKATNINAADTLIAVIETKLRNK
ncbi:glutathione synthase [Facilibium subflavum]|uniref:glutathione synthase n=1 Tax=Facilibium subflavum TaxID=2219058 RepID=UPI000E651172|nr:glutathione synthase [Facilibium subflavum]